MSYRTPTRILGIDPAFTKTGWALVEVAPMQPPRVLRSGMVETKSTREVADNLAVIYTNIAGVIHETRPDEIAIEMSFSGPSAKTTIRLGQASGVITVAIQHHAGEARHSAGYLPSEVKAAVGSGGDNKDQVRNGVRALIGKAADILLEDECDAVAVAICHAQKIGLCPESDKEE